MLEASIAPSALPAPTKVCNSSMNRMMPSAPEVTSCNTAFRRSSNSPRYFEPAKSEPRSSANSFLFFRLSGTSPLTMRCAKPSTMAVLPTPGSPISTGLFLVRRQVVGLFEDPRQFGRHVDLPRARPLDLREPVELGVDSAKRGLRITPGGAD